MGRRFPPRDDTPCAVAAKDRVGRVFYIPFRVVGAARDGGCGIVARAVACGEQRKHAAPVRVGGKLLCVAEGFR